MPLSQPNLSGKNFVHCGPASMGCVAKLSNNLALAIQMISVAEAMTFGTSLGMDPNVLASIMNTSSASCWASTVNHPVPGVMPVETAPANNNYAGGFASKLMLKDLSLALAQQKSPSSSPPFSSLHKGEAEGQGQTITFLPLATAASELYTQVVAAGDGAKDFGVIYRHLKDRQGSSS